MRARQFAMPESLIPTVDDVALLLRTRTVGGARVGLGGDTGPGPRNIGTFTEETRPTALEVERLIEMSAGTVAGEVRTPLAQLPLVQVPRARLAIALHAAILVESSFFREQADDAAVTVLRDMYATEVDGISAAIAGGSASAARPTFGTIRVTADRDAPLPTTGYDVGI